MVAFTLWFIEIVSLILILYYFSLVIFANKEIGEIELYLGKDEIYPIKKKILYILYIPVRSSIFFIHSYFITKDKKLLLVGTTHLSIGIHIIMSYEHKKWKE